MEQWHSVERYGPGDHINVYGEHGQLMVSAVMGPNGPLHPDDAAEAREKPWFFTGSPFGAQIVGLAWERHGRKQRAA